MRKYHIYSQCIAGARAFGCPRNLLAAALFILTHKICEAQHGSRTFFTNETFTVPPGITQLTIEVMGKGGAGGDYGGGGGGGGGFAKGVYQVIPGSTLNVVLSTYDDTVSVKPFLYATAGKDGKAGDDQYEPGKGGKGGRAGGGNLINSYGGDGGAGWPYKHGAGGGGAGGISGNGANGSSAPFSAPSPTWTGPKGGAGGGGLAGDGGYGVVSYYYTPGPTSYGGGGGGLGPSGSGYSRKQGYCHIAWGSCYTPPRPHVMDYWSPCANQSATLSAKGYEPLIWMSDTLNNTAITTGTRALIPILSQDTIFYARSKSACGNYSEPIFAMIQPMHITPVSASVSPASVCFGSTYTLTASGAWYYSWSTGHQSNIAVLRNNVTTPGDKTVSIVVTGEDYACPGTAAVSVVLKGKPVFHSYASKTFCCERDTVTLSGWGPSISACLWSNGQQSFSTSVVIVGTPAYSVTVTFTDGCTFNYPVSLSNLTPPVQAYATASTLCKGNAVELIALGASSYTWSTGESGNLITVAPEQNITYTVTGRYGGCTNSTEIEVKVWECTGLREHEAKKLALYPNPSNGSFITGRAGRIIVTDARGIQVFSEVIERADQAVDLQLASGIYFVSMEGRTQKLILLDR